MSEVKRLCRCDYCNKEMQLSDDEMVEQYVPELNSIYCLKCLKDYDVRARGEQESAGEG